MTDMFKKAPAESAEANRATDDAEGDVLEALLPDAAPKDFAPVEISEDEELATASDAFPFDDASRRGESNSSSASSSKDDGSSSKGASLKRFEFF
eukprot:10532051-Karenia_brevis.AAC.1